MIIDSLSNIGKYVALNPHFEDVADYVKKNDLASKPVGKEVLKGNDLFVNFCLAEGKLKAEAKLESHNEMIDIQIPLSGSETMGYTPRADLLEQSYDAEKDITFYPEKAQQYVTIHPGMFVIFFPQDGHAPCISNEKTIHKVIFKVKAEKGLNEK